MKTLARPRCRSVHVSAFHVLSDRHSALQLQVASSERHPARCGFVAAVAIMTFHFGCKAVYDAIYAAGNRPKAKSAEWRYG